MRTTRRKKTLKGRLERMSSSTKRRVRSLLGRPNWDDIKRYVGTDEASGGLQFELLRREGCVPTSKVLEIGCGALNAGIHLMPYLDPGHFVGIDPNEWLRETAMKKEGVRGLVEERRPVFLSNDEFDASELGIEFDFVLSHSVLSHAAHWQLRQYLENASRVLAPGGRILASLRLAEGNPYGNRGSHDKEDTKAETWQYPGGVWFKTSTIRKTAGDLGLKAVHVPEYTEFYTKTRPSEVHDWIVFSRYEAPE